jgi:serine kinase of HPr protein (carbohydrate metabolism regulator)
VTGLTTNIHATALVLDGRGVIVLGKSGSGKTSLALELLWRCHTDNISCALIADDRVDLVSQNGELIASVPDSLAGLVEVRGSGIHRIPFENLATLHLAVRLVEPEEVERIAPQGEFSVALGLGLATLFLPENQSCTSARAILSHLSLFSPLLAGKISQ